MAVDAKHHLIVAHEVTNVGSDRAQLSKMARQARGTGGFEALTVIADRGYFKDEEILACDQAGMTPLVPKPLTSGSKAEGRFGKQDFVYISEDNEYRCPAGERLIWRFANVERGQTMLCRKTLASSRSCRAGCRLDSRAVGRNISHRPYGRGRYPPKGARITAFRAES